MLSFLSWKRLPQIWGEFMYWVQKSAPNPGEDFPRSELFALNPGYVYAQWGETCPESGGRFSDVGIVCLESGARLCTVGEICPKSEARFSEVGMISPRSGAYK